MVLVVFNDAGTMILRSTDVKEIEVALQAIGAVRRDRTKAGATGKEEERA